MVRSPRFFGLLLLAHALCLAAGCTGRTDQETPAFATVIDDAGREVRVATEPARVVSLIPATTEMVLALGAGDRLVARTDYDRYPEIAHLPSVGQGLTPSIEWLIAQRADLVIAWPDGQARSVVGRLTELGIPVYGARIETLDDVASTIRRLGALLGRREAADSLVAAIDADLAAVRRAVAGRERPRVFYVVGYDPAMTAGPSTFLDELIDVAGGTNIFGDGPAGWPQVSLEEAIRRRPDILLLPQGEGNVGPARLGRMPGWRELEAVREGRIQIVDANTAHRPGPNIGKVARELARLLHPGLAVEEATP